jgi:hypothetical protein
MNGSCKLRGNASHCRITLLVGKVIKQHFMIDKEMANQKINLNSEVTTFLDNLNHPLRNEIEQLRLNILSVNTRLTENIKWNGPNYSFDNNDRITMRIQPPKHVQLIFHCGAKVQKQPKEKLINDDTGQLTWRENDRAIATFKNMTDIENNKAALTKNVADWIRAASSR